MDGGIKEILIVTIEGSLWFSLGLIWNEQKSGKAVFKWSVEVRTLIIESEVDFV